MKILLTGATGFIGAAFLRLALKEGHEVAALVRSSNHHCLGLDSSRLHLIPGDLKNPSWKEIEAFSPEVCLHSAWIATPGVYLESPENYKLVEDSFSFLTRMAELGASHIIGLGTCIEYQITGEQRLLSEEKTPIQPSTTYAKCKNELRLRLEASASRNRFGLCWGRVFYPYGPGEHPARLCSSIIARLSRGEKVELKTPESTKDYIFIEDLAAAVLHVVTTEFTGIVNLGTGVGVSVREIAHAIARMLNADELISETPVPEPDPLGYVVADAARIRGLGWSPQVDLKSGLHRIVDWKFEEASRTR